MSAVASEFPLAAEINFREQGHQPQLLTQMKQKEGFPMECEGHPR